MDERSTGLILRTRPLTESSLIVEWLTRDFGRLSTVAKGARRPKSPFLGKLDLFYLAEFSFHRSARSELHTLREVSVRSYHEPLRRNLGYLRQAAYFAHLLERTTETATPVPELFQLMAELLAALSEYPPRIITVFAFEMKLLAEQGLKPNLMAASLTPGSREVLELISSADWHLIARLKLSRSQSEEMDRFLQQFILAQLGSLLKTRAPALLEI